MPYIDRDKRAKLDPLINQLLDKLVSMDAANQFSDGDMNYIITRFIDKFYGGQFPSYTTLNAGIGVLEAAKLEFYRRRVALYEDGKIQINGDAYN